MPNMLGTRNAANYSGAGELTDKYPLFVITSGCEQKLSVRPSYRFVFLLWSWVNFLSGCCAPVDCSVIVDGGSRMPNRAILAGWASDESAKECGRA